MSSVATIKGQVQTVPIERILGQQVTVLDRMPIQVNNFVAAEYIEVSYPENAWPEEHARLNLFPIEDGKFYVHIMYLQIDDKEESGRVCWIEYKPEFFDQYPLDTIAADIPFKFDKVSEQQFSICTNSSALLEQLLHTKAEPTVFARILQQTELATQLFRRAMECIAMPFTVCPVPACSFLANETEHSKIIEAQAVIQGRLDSPLTIKELSRKVAMNECYLKKGFKALTGKTIHQYTQELRIAKAKELLNEKGLSVSDVANELGYSSISHFSTAFKRATGTKPCELLK